MITERNQGAEKTFTPGPSSTSAPRERRLFLGKRSRIPVRRGVSQHVLETAKRLMQKYQEDLDYLRDH